MTLFENICEVVCAGEGVELEELKNDSRKIELVYPRQLIMFLARKLKIGSFAVIGNHFHRDHATVLHACKSIQNYIDTDIDKRDNIDGYLKKLKKIKEVLKMSFSVEEQIKPLREEINHLQNKVVNLQLLVNNIDNFVRELKL